MACDAGARKATRILDVTGIGTSLVTGKEMKGWITVGIFVCWPDEACG